LPVSHFPLSILPEAKPTINCFQALDYFQTGRAHLLLISEHPGHAYGAIGVVTLEDIIEEMINEEIVDETDRYTDNQTKKAVKRQSTAAVMRGIIERQRRIKGSRGTSPNGSVRGRDGRGISVSRTAIAADDAAKLVAIEESPKFDGTAGSGQNGTHQQEVPDSIPPLPPAKQVP